jgi:hypothetical protein
MSKHSEFITRLKECVLKCLLNATLSWIFWCQRICTFLKTWEVGNWFKRVFFWIGIMILLSLLIDICYHHRVRSDKKKLSAVLIPCISVKYGWICSDCFNYLKLSWFDEPTQSHTAFDEPTQSHTAFDEPTQSHTAFDEPTQSHTAFLQNNTLNVSNKIISLSCSHVTTYPVTITGQWDVYELAEQIFS